MIAYIFMNKQSSGRLWRKLAEKPWFLIALFLLSAADLFVIVIPVEGLTLATVLARRKHWLRPALAMALGSTLGCIALAELTYWNAPWVLSRLGSLQESSSWSWIQSHINTLGAGVVILGAYTPIPLQVLTVAPALGGLKPELLYPALAIGRFGRAILLCWAASHAKGGLSRMLSQFKKARRELNELDR
jgi:membrane protein YqaA with SNARE-associated domain